MDFTISLSSVLIIISTFFFIVLCNSESKLRNSILNLRMEHHEKLAELSSENRELKYKLCHINRELKHMERRIEKLERER